MCVCFAGNSCKRDDQESGHWWGDPFDPGRRETTEWNQPAHTAHHEENQGIYLVRTTNCSLESKIHKFFDLAPWKHGQIFETSWRLRCSTVSYNPQYITEFWNSSELILRFMCNIKDNFPFMTHCLCWCGGALRQQNRILSVIRFSTLSSALILSARMKTTDCFSL